LLQLVSALAESARGEGGQLAVLTWKWTLKDDTPDKTTPSNAGFC